MKAYTKIFLTTVALGGMLWSCAPDKVGPKNDDQSNDPSIGFSADGGHIVLNPQCSDLDTFGFISQATVAPIPVLPPSTTVNYCPAPNTSACGMPWGFVLTYNTPDTLVVYYSMALGWAIDVVNSVFTTTGNIQLDANGFPITNNDWITFNQSVNPNTWTQYVNLANIVRDQANCFSYSARLAVFRTNFLGAPVAASRRTLWIYNDQYLTPGDNYNPASPYVVPNCWSFCPAPIDTICTDLTPSYTCKTLAPDVSSLTSSAVVYDWSNGATTPSITVCPGETVEYYTVTITETPSRVPVATYTYCMPVMPPADSLCVSYFTGLPASAGTQCVTIAPSVNHPGALRYQWSTGATTASINVCTATDIYVSVTISEALPSQQIVARYIYRVTANDARCYAGNSPHHKVWVCHLPPGNPANQQDICIDWSGVPAHVARFRGPSYNPRHGHDSGCEIGRCGYNPCN